MPKDPKNFIFEIQVECQADSEEEARLELARRLKRSGIQIVTGLKLLKIDEQE